MKKIHKIYIPSIAITFTLTVLYSCIWNLISGSSMSDYFYFLLEFLVYLVGTVIIDAILNRIDFKNNFSYFFTELIVLYLFMLLFAYCGNWFTFTFSTLFPLTLFFVATVGYIYYYFYKSWKIEADEINQLLNERQQNNTTNI